ncbi:SDR family NAD(P)-dependent oxidoreductase [Thalassotalea marina]|uniref:Retinol dehydrogenase n=1 Tax=Thalassotalea marina TaxID=1673741 RepID=A0A919BDZ1_9GAMM|nr:SDR family NAD(P)-dependent oxidoreductase [Thalassotalea marina]GHF84340.1 retinol dehydrogenase [Thalassotalea marina]
MTVKTILVTGATSGIGKQVLKSLAIQGHKLIVIARCPEKIKLTINEVKNDAPNTVIYSYVADFSDVDSVTQVAQKISTNHPVIDVLINNAGAMHMKEEVAKCGREKTLVVNHISHAALTLALINNLKLASQGCIINVSSDCYRLPGYDLNCSDFDGKYNWNKAYNRSKLAQIQFTHVLQDKLNSDNIVVTSVSPGGVKTDIYRALPKIARWLVSLTLKPVERGVDDILKIANLEDASMFAGQFVSKGKVKTVEQKFLSPAVLTENWQISTNRLATENFAV